jgi:hypothetical protein
MTAAIPVSTIAHLIQLSIAPVFLLAGVGAILNVLANRLARVVRCEWPAGRFGSATNCWKATWISRAGKDAACARFATS